MEVRRSDFPSRLLEILEAISESHFVAIDFEHSGVPVRTFGKQNNVKATLQERYTETKLAAEKYQILQIGLTCVYEDVTNQEYTLQPFNIALSPLIFEKLDFDRDFTFHSGAVEFLNKYGFDYQIPLRDGVPYLSHHEIELIKSRGKTREEERQENDEFSDKSLTNHWLVHSILTKVDLWLKQYPTTDDVLFLGPLELLQANDIDQSLSRLEKRVIHYAVRSEHPRLRTIGRQDGVEIRLFDPERETYYQKKRADELRERINRQKGFGYVIDALAGKNIANIDVRSFTKHPESGRYDCVNRDARARFQRCQALIHNKPKTIVGHNLFLDMIYLYRTFFGELPDTVEEYCEKLHELFPMVVDTKYLATAECGDNMPTSSLQQLATEFGQGQLPIISITIERTVFNKSKANLFDRGSSRL